MKVAVAGGTGVLGTLLVAELARRGDEVLALSRNDPRELPAGAAHQRVDLRDGKGLAEALAGAEVVIDAWNAPPNRGAELVAGSRRLLDATGEARARHLIGISIVGCDRVPLAYFKAKVTQERLLERGPVPWSLLRASQFHDLLDRAFDSAARWRVLPTGMARLQPVDAALVAERVTGVAHAEPAGRLPDVAGPEVQTLSELAKAWRETRGRRLLPLRVPMMGKIGRPLREAALCDPAVGGEGMTFAQWLSRRRNGR